MLQIRQQILDGFKSCGYKNNLLQESYQYFDGKESRTAEIVGFYQPTYNSATACIAAIDKTKLNEKKIETELLPYQLLGCPVLLVYDDSGVQFWKNSGIQVAFHEQIEPKTLSGFFSKYKKDFFPESIHRAKTIGRVKKEYQLSFADIGSLMGIVEEKEGKYLSELTEKIIKSLKANCASINEDKKFGKWLVQAAFWLIGAKILKDKQVPRFKNLEISNVADLIKRVQGHYSATEMLDISNNIQKKAFEKIAKEIAMISSFAHLTTESLAYVYENALVRKETRKLFGTHATPSWLVNYIVLELIDWIEAIPQAKRIILEPACGHAPFLTTGAKLLTDPLLYKGVEKDRHDYLKRHLIGIDVDSFAEEIAKLALTLADIPNPNGWNIQHSDIYENDILKKAAQKATILFCNPPFEDFKKEKQKYNNIKTGNKAAEVLEKTLSYLPDDSVFGIILPQGFLHRRNLADLRKYILDNFELRTICNLPDNVFAKGKHLSTVLLARKRQSKAKIVYLRINNKDIETFKNTYQASSEIIDKDTFYHAQDYSFRIPALKDIWDYCKRFHKIKEYAVIGRGIEYKHFEKSVQKHKFPDSTKGFGNFERIINGKKGRVDIQITELPDYYWLSTKAGDIANQRYGLKENIPQVIANYARSGGDAWRIKGFIDLKGLPVTKHFLVIRPKPEKNIPLNVIWALINSPFANAYMYCHCMERLNMEGTLRNMPVPFESQDFSKLNICVQDYFAYSQQHPFALQNKSDEKKRQLLLSIDAEILRLYQLPPRIERELLNFFEGIQRKGVDFKFDRYYETGFESYIPLHIYISNDYRNSTFKNVQKWVDRNRTPQVIEAFEIASKERSGK